MPRLNVAAIESALDMLDLGRTRQVLCPLVGALTCPVHCACPRASDVPACPPADDPALDPRVAAARRTARRHRRPSAGDAESSRQYRHATHLAHRADRLARSDRAFATSHRPGLPRPAGPLSDRAEGPGAGAHLPARREHIRAGAAAVGLTSLISSRSTACFAPSRAGTVRRSTRHHRCKPGCSCIAHAAAHFPSF